MRWALAAVLAAAWTGCRASVVELRKKAMGPVPEVGIIDPGGGHMRYALTGPAFLVRRRRANAFSRMAEYCGGDNLVRVQKEYSRDDIETPYQAEDLDVTIAMNRQHYKVNPYRHIEFECLKKP